MIYKVDLFFHGNATVEVEARDEEHAEDLACQQVYDDPSVGEIEINDVAVYKADDQYTAEQELEDADRRHEDKE